MRGVSGTKRRAKGKAGQQEGAEVNTKKRKRKKAKRLPKNFDPDNPGPPPDPERWLPKWQRAEFKRKRRSRKDKARMPLLHTGAFEIKNRLLEQSGMPSNKLMQQKTGCTGSSRADFVMLLGDAGAFPFKEGLLDDRACSAAFHKLLGKSE